MTTAPTPPPAPSAAAGTVPGKTLGIVALVQSRKAGYKNGPAIAAIIVGALLTIVAIVVIISVASVIGVATEAYQACEAVDFSGTVIVAGAEISCTTVSR